MIDPSIERRSGALKCSTQGVLARDVGGLMFGCDARVVGSLLLSIRQNSSWARAMTIITAHPVPLDLV